MKTKTIILVCLTALTCSRAFALEPDEILVIANSSTPASVRIAEDYCAKRNVPKDNILALPLGASLNDSITRLNYEKLLAEPVRRKLSEPAFIGRIRCLLTTYGVPIKVQGRGQLQGMENELVKLQAALGLEKAKLDKLNLRSPGGSPKQKALINDNIRRIQSSIDYITGRETNASVDSELAMVQFGRYELYRWQLNNIKTVSRWDFTTLMVSRLDGPGENIAIGLIDKAISAEKTGLKGIVYIDSRGIANDNKPYSFGYFDQSLRDLAAFMRLHANSPVKEEKTENLFEPNTCPQTTIYCGWYSLRKYIDAFNFVDGAIGYHISSFEAVDLRDPDSTQWCPAMLRRGVTATIGAVAEPYLSAFPEPKAFFAELVNGRCLVEAYYLTSPFNSWQLVLIGDPLYTPFKKNQASIEDILPLNLYRNKAVR